MKKESAFVIVYLKGGKQIKISNESNLDGILDEYDNAVKAELYFVEENVKRLITTAYK